MQGSENGRLSIADSKFFLLQLLLGIKYLHSKKITHRDIKCENILLSDRGRSPILKISDFGLSKTLREMSDNTICGTKNYSAPELIRNDPHYSNKVDIWSSGVVLYAMITGSLKFLKNLFET